MMWHYYVICATCDDMACNMAKYLYLYCICWLFCVFFVFVCACAGEGVETVVDSRKMKFTDIEE